MSSNLDWALQEIDKAEREHRAAADKIASQWTEHDHARVAARGGEISSEPPEAVPEAFARVRARLKRTKAGILDRAEKEGRAERRRRVDRSCRNPLPTWRPSPFCLRDYWSAKRRRAYSREDTYGANRGSGCHRYRREAVV